MSKFTFEKKFEWFKRFVNYEGGYKSLGNKKYGISHNLIKKWVLQYNIMVRKGLLKAIQTIQFSLKKN